MLFVFVPVRDRAHLQRGETQCDVGTEVRSIWLYRHGQGANKSWRFALHDLRVRGARPCVRYRTQHRGPAARQRSIGSHYTRLAWALALYRNSRLHTHSSTHSFFEAAGVPKASRGTYTHARCLVQSWASMPRLHQLQASKNHAALPSGLLTRRSWHCPRHPDRKCVGQSARRGRCPRPPSHPPRARCLTPPSLPLRSQPTPAAGAHACHPRP